VDDRQNCRMNSDTVTTLNHWVSGLCPSSGILNTGKHNVSETESISVLR
jgi:hypothetical protein